MGSTLASAPGMYPRLRFPAPPDPRRTREYTYFGPHVAGGTFSPATKTSRGGHGAGELRLSLGHGGEALSPRHARTWAAFDF